MGIIIRQGLKASVFIYIGVAIGGFITIWLYPKLLKPEEIGTIQLVQGLAFLCAGVLQFGTSDIVNKFLPVFFDKKKKHYGFFTFISLYLLIGFFIYAVIFIVFQNFWISFYIKESPEIIVFFYHIIPYALFIALNAVLEAYIRGHLRIVVPAAFREVVQRILIIGFVVSYSMGFISFEQLVFSIIGIQLILILALLMYIKNLKVFFLTTVSLDFLNRERVQDILTFVFFVYFGGLSNLIIVRVDSLMVGAFLGPAQVGIYGISAYIAGVIEIPQRAVSQISTAIVGKAWKENDLKSIEEIYRKTSINLLLVGSFIFLGIWCNVDYIFEIMPNGVFYSQGKYVILFIGLARLIDMGTGVNTLIILQSQYYRFNLILAFILALMIVVSNLIFIEEFGIVGVAFATTASMVAYNLIKFLFLWIKFRIQPFGMATVKALVLAGLVYVLTILLPRFENVWLNIFFTSTFITLTFAGLTYLLNISEDANKILHQLIRLVLDRINLYRK